MNRRITNCAICLYQGAEYRLGSEAIEPRQLASAMTGAPYPLADISPKDGVTHLHDGALSVQHPGNPRPAATNIPLKANEARAS